MFCLLSCLNDICVHVHSCVYIVFTAIPHSKQRMLSEHLDTSSTGFNVARLWKCKKCYKFAPHRHQNCPNSRVNIATARKLEPRQISSNCDGQHKGLGRSPQFQQYQLRYLHSPTQAGLNYKTCEVLHSLQQCGNKISQNTTLLSSRRQSVKRNLIKNTDTVK